MPSIHPDPSTVLLASPHAQEATHADLGLDLRLSVDAFLQAINGQEANHHALGTAPTRQRLACDRRWLEASPATMIVNRAEWFLPQLAGATAHVAGLLGLAAENLHLRAHCSAWPDSFGLHFDPHENLVCQADGHKLCRYSAQPEADAWSGRGSTLASPAMLAQLPQLPRVDLEAGQVLFMPAGTWHQFSAQGASLAFSFAWNRRAPLVRPEPSVRVAWHKPAATAPRAQRLATPARAH